MIRCELINVNIKNYGYLLDYFVNELMLLKNNE